MKKEQVPENAIDRFFYKIVRAIKGAGKTIIESKTVGKILFRSGLLSILLWIELLYLIWIAAGGEPLCLYDYTTDTILPQFFS